MFSTSLDVLNLIICICLIFLTFFLCWSLYYFASSLRKINAVVKKVEQGVAKAEDLIEMIREKSKNSSAYFMILGKIAKKALEFVQEKRNTNKETNKETSKKSKKK